MKLKTLKNVVGFFLVFGHLSALLLIMLLSEGFRPKEIPVVIAIVAPLSALNVAAVVRSAIADYKYRSLVDGQKIDGLFLWIALVFSVVSSMAVPILVFLRATQFISPFESCRLFLTIVETACGATVGLIIDELFRLPDAGVELREKKPPPPDA
jgi:ABC-type maltose transport system permease subunit